MLFSLFIIFVLLISLLSTLFFYILNGIGPTPSSLTACKILKHNLPAVIQGDIVDAGAGFGGIALQLAKQYPNNTVYAFENAWLPFCILWCRKKYSMLPNLIIKFNSFTSHPLKHTGLIYTFLCRKGMQEVSNWLIKNHSFNGCLVSNFFQLPADHPNKPLLIESKKKQSLYLYYFHKQPE